MTLPVTQFQDEFKQIMNNLPVPVPEEDIEEMFQFADNDEDGELSYTEFLVKTFLWKLKGVDKNLPFKILYALYPSFYL